MAITKTTTADKIETLEDGSVQVRTATVIKDSRKKFIYCASKNS